MGNNMSINSPIFATVTPFNQDDNIDEMAFIDYLAFLEKVGVKSILVNGTTGEFPSLTFEERIETCEIAKKNFNGKVISDISSCCYREANELARLSVDADALLLLPPYYYDVKNEGGLVGFFKNALKGIRTPTYIYNFPFYTKVSLSKQDIVEIHKACANIVGLKDSGKDLGASKSFSENIDDFDVFVAGDMVALNVLEIGLKGSISGAGNPFPEFLVALSNEWRKGNYRFAVEIQNKFNVWNTFRRRLRGYEISIVKEVLSKRIDGFPTATRCPINRIDERDKQLIEENYSHIYALATQLYG
uniref:4-hydroxy-tetrahydrodipicolinate synthase n=1 Tax=Candidatus Kentrum sp. FW TaxID=2126338 RepID=A0A450TST4_9GAMM|nr:MAG: 4-hydroxy-tetrahydrodipicolinate synthase [Candidatus Kentron sp. FW]